MIDLDLLKHWGAAFLAGCAAAATLGALGLLTLGQ